MKRVLLLTALFGCQQDVGLNEVDARLSVATLVDLNTRVGEAQPFTIELEHTRGQAVEVLEVAVINVQGAAFTYEGEQDLVLNPGETLELPFVYSPVEAGFDAAALSIRTNAVNGDFQVTARGRASVPELHVFPAAIDFGPVSGSGTESVRLENRGLEAVELAGTLSDPRFTVAGLPTTVPPEGFITLPITFEPLDDDPVSAQLSLTLGAEVVATVQLRSNDCAHGNPSLYDADADGVTGCSGDCDDNDAAVRPGAPELLDAVDNNCNGIIDEGTTGFDDDADGFCELGPCADGSTPGDCNDNNNLVFPGAIELDNGIDDDCDGQSDAGSEDADGDGVSPPQDCDDSNAAIRPGALEVIDGIDNDCDGTIDEGTAAYDDDGDGSCEATSCAGGAVPGDCNDEEPSTYPGAVELPDFIDNDCDGTIDEGTENEDADGDGFTPAGGDCDDGDAGVNPVLGGC